MPFTLFAIVLATQARTPQAEAKTIADACARAFRVKDRRWFERHLAAGFVYTNLEGEREGRQAMLDRLDRWFHPFLYRVEPTLSVITARRMGKGMLVVSDLRVISQPIRLWRTPVTETTVRVETHWLPQGKEWFVQQMVERSTQKLVDGKPSPD